MNAITKRWLLKIADAVEHWPAMRRDRVEIAMIVTTPAGAMHYSLSQIPDRGVRADVVAALPVIGTEDYTAAAEQIRQAAARAVVC
jgi:hypothetical protein